MELKGLLDEVSKKNDEGQCLALLNKELKSLRRPQFVLRIYGRFSRLRAERERKALIEKGVLPK
jgi:hypothetical protein